MYSPLITAQQLEVAQRSLDFPLSYSSLGRVDAYVAHLNSLINLDRWREKREIEFRDTDRQSRLSRGESPFEPDEEEWIKNERNIARFDYCYFASRYCFITDSLGRGLVHYKPNIAQSILNDIRAEAEEAYAAICLYQLKGRQAGISTDNQLVLGHRVLFWDDTHVMTASSTPLKSAKLHSKMELMFNHVPYWMFPKRWEQKTTGEERVTCEEIRTSVTLQHGTQESGISRGDTINCAHLSELPEWDDPRKDIEASLLKAMHFNPETYVCIESTAATIDDWFHEKWKEAEEFYPQGLEIFRPFFLPWFISSDIYPTPTEVRQFFNPIRTTWKPKPVTIAHALRAQQSVDKNPFYQRYLGKGWKMPVEQMWWWEWEYERAKRGKRLGEWLGEVPATSDEAFQVTGTSIFDSELIHDLRQSVKHPLMAFEISGGEITPRMLPQGVHYDNRLDDQGELLFPPIPVTFSSNKYKANYILRPLRVDDWETFNPQGKLIIWEFPQDNEEYVYSLDASEGVEQDNTICDVLRKSDGIRHDEQVAQFCSNLISGADFDEIALAIGSFYTVLWNNEKYKRPMFVPELAKGGGTCIDKMLKKGWGASVYVHTPANNKVRDASKVSVLGWPSNQATREEVLNNFIHAVRERGETQTFQINSRWTINEMSTFGIHPRKRRLEALGGAKDDRIFGVAIPLFALYAVQLRGRGEASWQRRMRIVEHEESKVVEYSYGAMGLMPSRRLIEPREMPDDEMMTMGEVGGVDWSQYA